MEDLKRGAKNTIAILRKDGVNLEYPGNYRYTKSGQWLLLEGRVSVIGITDYAQNTLGEIDFAELPSLDQAVEAEASFCSTKSVKSMT